MKRYTFAQVAKRECAECTTTITTTLQTRYCLASDVDALLAQVEKALGGWEEAWMNYLKDKDQSQDVLPVEATNAALAAIRQAKGEA
jgi:hypothetical protein